MTDSSTQKPSDAASQTSETQQHGRLNRKDIVGRTQLPLPSLTGFEQISQAALQRTQEKIAAAHPLFLLASTERETEPQVELSSSPATEPPLVLPANATNDRQPAAIPPQRKRKRLMFLIIAACLLIVGVLILGYSYFMLMPSTRATADTLPKKATSISVQTNPHNNEPYNAAPGVTSIHVGTAPTLTISGHSGNVTIHAGAAGTISINTYNQGTQMTQSHNGTGHDAISIVPQILNENVNYDITVPTTTQISIIIDSGSMSVNGVSAASINTTSGTMDIENVTGPVQAVTVNSDIKLQNIKGPMTLRTLNGTINANRVQGQMNAATQYGDVLVQNAALSQQSVLKTTNGSIRFAGTLNPTGSYSLTTASGNITLTLPKNAAFQLQANTQSGSVNNAFGSNSVGGTVQAQIVTSIGSGSVTIQKQNN